MGSTLKGTISLLNKTCTLNFLNEFWELFDQDSIQNNHKKAIDFYLKKHIKVFGFNSWSSIEYCSVLLKILSDSVEDAGMHKYFLHNSGRDLLLTNLKILSNYNKC